MIREQLQKGSRQWFSIVEKENCFDSRALAALKTADLRSSY